MQPRRPLHQRRGLRPLVLALVALLAATLLTTPASAHEDWREHLGDFTGPVLPPSPVSPQAADLRLQLLGHANPGVGVNADVYAHGGYAYLASFIGRDCLSKGIRVYSLRDPANPRRVVTFADKVHEPDLVGTWTEKVIVKRVRTRSFAGDIAVVSVQACDRFDPEVFRGFAVYDVTDPTRPRRLARYDSGRPNASVEGSGGAHELWLGAANGRAFVYAAVPFSEVRTAAGSATAPDPSTLRPGKPDLRIVEITDPRHPRDVGGWGAWKERGVYPLAAGREHYERLTFAHSVRTDPGLRRAYVSYWGYGTVILDIENPSHPRFLGRTKPPEGSAHSADVMRDGRVLVETHEQAAGLPSYYDISDPRHPRLLSRFVVKGYQRDSVHDPKVRGGRTYFSWYGHGVVVADSRDARHPRLLAQWRPKTTWLNPDWEYCDKGCPQVWGVFVTLSGLVLASDMNSGLYVLRLRRR